MQLRRLTLLWLLGTALSCAPRPGAGEFIFAKVTWEPGVTARCFVVRVNAEGQPARTTKPMLRGVDDERLAVAIFRDESPAEVSLEALGFADEACLEPSGEQSVLTPASFVKVLSETGVTLRVLERPIMVGTDVDGDGSATPEDCDDGNPAVRPGLPEACGDSFDNDCDDIFDCDDSECVAQSCGLGRVCLGPVCGEAACTNGVDDDGDLQVDCADPDCADEPCGGDGTCRLGRCLASTEARCDDGDDNDGDGLTDCLDPQCEARACSDGDGCTAGESCTGPVCGGASARDCGTGLPLCLLNAGCDAGQCLATPKTSGTACGNACTQAGLCDGDGGCSGAPVICPAPPNACFGAGTCQLALDGGCAYPLLTGSTCSDLDGCTVQDACQGDGGCAGTRLDCTPPQECLAWANTCSAGMCEFAPRVGLACDGGTCNGAGVCTPGGSPWPYMPANFDPTALAFSDGGIIIECVDVILDTEPTPATVSGVGCSSRTALPSGGTLSGGALVFAASSLFIDAGARLTLVGTRPVIFAVSGDVTIAGALVAAANGARPGAGADVSCGAAAGTTGDAGTASRPGGSGGAFGSAGGAGGPGAGNAGTPPGESTPVGTPSLVPLRGGCSGGAGAGSGGGARGRAGGAVQVSSTGALVISGLVGAPGEGGRGAGVGSFGGGGAGSGGGIVLEASTLQLTSAGRVLALGGGGGEGSAGAAGNDGAAGSRTDGGAAAGGDLGSALGGTGGMGASRHTDAGAGAAGQQTTAFGGGGGGGAGVGRVRFNALSCNFVAGSLVSPAPPSADGGCQ